MKRKLGSGAYSFQFTLHTVSPDTAASMASHQLHTKTDCQKFFVSHLRSTIINLSNGIDPYQKPSYRESVVTSCTLKIPCTFLLSRPFELTECFPYVSKPSQILNAFRNWLQVLDHSRAHTLLSLFFILQSLKLPCIYALKSQMRPGLTLFVPLMQTIRTQVCVELIYKNSH